ncbi:MAG: beta-galactosidase trimerization domain-containing protein, partial [Clostridia bacterium]|nr:beta-galactosidase trimerization domain-containing protein [Clostridia bacterium]
AAYVRTLDKAFLGMTGKFHTTWGEFGGFKHPNALIYETGLSLACSACCSVGDQLHPSGEMNMSTYRLIGAAYEQVEKKEPWCRGAVNEADIAVLSCEAVLGSGRGGFGTESNTGANRILLEGKHLFDFIDEQADFSRYKLLVLPDQILLGDALAARLNGYIAQGGRVLLTGLSGLNRDRTGFALDVGADFAGLSPFRPDYMIPRFAMMNGETAYVMYAPGVALQNVRGEVLCDRQAPYFNRSWAHFSSHQHTPNDVAAPLSPAAVLNGRVAYIGWNVFEDYATKGELHVKELALHAVERLLGDERRVRTSLPDRGIVTVTKQEGRSVVHLLFAHTTVRGQGIEVIEDAVPLCGVAVDLRVDFEPKRVSLAPQGDELPFQYDRGRVRFTVPKVLLHQMVAVE